MNECIKDANPFNLKLKYIENLTQKKHTIQYVECAFIHFWFFRSLWQPQASYVSLLKNIKMFGLRFGFRRCERFLWLARVMFALVLLQCLCVCVCLCFDVFHLLHSAHTNSCLSKIFQPKANLSYVQILSPHRCCLFLFSLLLAYLLACSLVCFLGLYAHRINMFGFQCFNDSNKHISHEMQYRIFLSREMWVRVYVLVHVSLFVQSV